MAAIATIVAAVGASILLWAALEKARDPGTTASTLRQLGVPAALPAAWLVIAAEFAVALALVFRPDAIVTQGGVVLLAAAFALAGLLALRLDEPVRCTCFGSGGRGTLGVDQLAALVPWAATAAVLNLADVARPSPSRGAAVVAAVALAMTGLRVPALVRAWWAARGDRRSARETYVWLRR